MNEIECPKCKEKFETDREPSFYIDVGVSEYNEECPHCETNLLVEINFKVVLKAEIDE